MTPSNDWRGVHPQATVFRKWVVAWILFPSSDGMIRSRHYCWTRSGAERLVNRLNADAARRDLYNAESLIAAQAFRFELVGNLKEHPYRG